MSQHDRAGRTLRTQLDADEGRAVLEIAHDLVARTGGVNAPGFAAELRGTAQLLPLRLRTFTARAAHRTDADLLRISGLPVDQGALGPTPEHWRNADTERSAPYGAALALVGSLLGGCLRWRANQDGRLVTDVFPHEGMEHSLGGASSTHPLGWHTEDANTEVREDYVGLLTLRNPTDTATCVAGVAAEDVPARFAGVLREPRFLITCEETPDATPPAVALLSGHPQRPQLRIDSDFTRVAEGDDAARAALDWLVGYLDEHLYDVPSRPGDMTFIDNRRLVHGRRAFRARFDGTDRWLKRIEVAVDVHRMLPARRDPAEPVHG